MNSVSKSDTFSLHSELDLKTLLVKVQYDFKSSFVKINIRGILIEVKMF